MEDPTAKTHEKTVPEHGEALRPGMPRWVKVFLIIGIILALVIIIGLITGKVGPGGPHGPGRHMPSGLGSATVTQTLDR
jgi:hypothetical protein